MMDVSWTRRESIKATGRLLPPVSQSSSPEETTAGKMEATEALDFLERPFKLDWSGNTGLAARTEASLSHRRQLEWDDGGENTVRMSVAVAKNAGSLTEQRMGDAVRETEKFWPAMGEYGIGGLSSAYLHYLDKVEPDFLRHSVCMDLRTFVDVFSDPVTLVNNLSVAADKIVRRWSECSRGNRPGELADESFRLRDVVQVSNRWEVKTSTLVISVGVSPLVDRNRLHDPEARIGPNDTFVKLKLFKGYPNRLQRPASSGVGVPFPAFVKLVQSEEMRSSVEAGQDFLRSLELSDLESLRWRFVKGDEHASEGVELMERLASKRKRRSRGGGAASKRQKKDILESADSGDFL